MPNARPPMRPNSRDAIVDPRTGRLTQHGLLLMESQWRQIVAGYSITPVVITQASVNVLTMKPFLHEEGAADFQNGMAFWGKAVSTTTGVVTAIVTRPTQALPTVKVYKTNGSAQATLNDILANSYYLFLYHADLNGGAGGLVRF